MQRWPVRRGRPYAQKLSPDVPLVTGQRVIDALFPIAKGGTAAIHRPLRQRQNCYPAPAGKWAVPTLLCTLAAVSAANEMTDVLLEFPRAD